MSQENVEIVRSLYEAITRRDSEAVLVLYDPWYRTRAEALEAVGLSESGG